MEQKKDSFHFSKPLILLWNKKTRISKVPQHFLCGGGCEITKNRKQIDDADAIVIQMKKMNQNDMPKLSKK